jgi:hypothetical protein
MERNKKTEQIRQRDFLIVKLLREIKKDSFCLNSKNENTIKILQQLSEKTHLFLGIIIPQN